MSMEETSTYEGPLTDTQYFILWGIGGVGCVLTWFGATSIIYISRRKLTSIYHRLLFVIAWIELISSSIGFSSPFMMNKATGYPLAIGNQASCSTVAVVILFAVISKAMSSCFISIYFMLTIRYNWKDKKVRAYERPAYLIAFTIPFSYCVVGLVNGFFNPNEFRFCAIAEYPIGCHGDECVRGENAAILSTVSTGTSIVISIIAITCTILLFLSVKHHIKQSTRHSFDGAVSEASMKRMKLVRTQTMMYLAVFLNNFMWLLLFNALVLNSVNTDDIHANDQAIFATGVMLFIFLPSYGFCIYCIYCYPRYARLRDHIREKSFLGRLNLLYSVDEGEGEIMASRRRQSQPLSGECTGAFSIARSQLGSSSKASGSGDIEMNEPADTSSFHGSGDTSLDKNERHISQDKPVHSNNDTAFSDEFLEDLDTDKDLYVEY